MVLLLAIMLFLNIIKKSYEKTGEVGAGSDKVIYKKYSQS